MSPSSREPDGDPRPDSPSGVTELRTRAMGLSALICVGFILLGSLLGWVTNAEPDLVWYGGLIRPAFSPPEVLVHLLGLAYYPVFAVLIYRALAQPHAPPVRRAILLLVTTAMTIHVVWNPILIGFQAPVVGIMGNGVLLGLMGLLAGFLWRRDRLGTILLLPYVALAGFDVVWTLELLRLNP